ncbi:complex I intermediate-associated protein 30, mitochondrial [Ctenocephalides felis]|uniref:complex I intermediate-associated protein 30, mitochondrial n=1 Tax=Ctenocephalides felis TaxID=7515 RepID=UPI000E6E4AEC|nr:complex I intermediate-associated protein 30, mitochondrial [Ctenocephalides felis]
MLAFSKVPKVICSKQSSNIYHRILLNNEINLINNVRLIYTTNTCKSFYERDRKGGYDTKPKEKIPITKLIKDGFKELKTELKLFKQEVIEHFRSDPIMVFRQGETDEAWHLGSKEGLKKWKVTVDKDHGEGYSTAKLELSPSGYGLFHGNIDMTVPQTGRIKSAGYANMQALRARKSFKRETYLDWTAYNTLVFRIRGDGRTYMINISTSGYYDIWWNDMYSYALYTRGGPYWQIAKIPFSKFFLTSKGRIQDKQYPIPLSRITALGISVSGIDGVGGPFSLELDYIGLEHDYRNKEEFAYEMYKTDRWIAGH